jgi:hypothetical protein
MIPVLYMGISPSKTITSDIFIELPQHSNCDDVTLFIFLEKTKQKSVMALETRCFQGRSP